MKSAGHTTTTLTVAESSPEYWCAHPDDVVTVCVSGGESIIYLGGTPDEIRSWCERVVANLEPPAENAEPELDRPLMDSGLVV